MRLSLNYDLGPNVNGQLTVKSKPHVNKSNDLMSMFMMILQRIDIFKSCLGKNTLENYS